MRNALSWNLIIIPSWSNIIFQFLLGQIAIILLWNFSEALQSRVRAMLQKQRVDEREGFFYDSSFYKLFTVKLLHFNYCVLTF
jgi:hypothetical protein